MTGKGLVQVYTGDGKGKTTAALGLAMRAAGHGRRVCIIQFLKSERCGEHTFAAEHHPFKIVQPCSIDPFSGTPEDLSREARRTLALAEEYMLRLRYDLLILDEVLVAVSKGFLSADDVLALLEKKPESLELVLTGRHAPAEIVARADLVTEMRAVKHPFRKGIPARRGIEY